MRNRKSNVYVSAEFQTKHTLLVSAGRTTYTYENMNFRMFPGIQQDSDEWVSL